MLSFHTQPKPRKTKSFWEKQWERVEKGEITKEDYDALCEKHKLELEKKRKYKQGEPLYSFEEVFTALEKDGFVWMFGRPKTYGFVGSQQVHTLKCMIEGNAICRVVKK